MVGSGLGARRGILFKNAVALEQAAGLDTIVFDKTGTLTRGEPEVVAMATADGVSEQELLRLVAGAEGNSEHPLARAIVNAAKSRGLPVPEAAGFTAIPGAGAIATVEGKRVAAGNGRLLDGEHVTLGGLSERAAALTTQGQTVVQVAIDGRAAGVIAIADAPPPARVTRRPPSRSAHSPRVAGRGQNAQNGECAPDGCVRLAGRRELSGKTRSVSRSGRRRCPRGGA
jgi:Cu2+-exporting ATPase